MNESPRQLRERHLREIREAPRALEEPGALELAARRLLEAAVVLDEALHRARLVRDPIVTDRAAYALRRFREEARVVQRTVTLELVKVTGEGVR